VLEKYPKEVKLVMVNFPLTMHPYARKAAIAALASEKQNKYWEMHDKLFANQKELSDAKVDEIAKEIGLDMEKFGRDLKAPEVAALVDRDLATGAQANVSGTPTIFVNGKQLNQRGLPAFQQAIDKELAKTAFKQLLDKEIKKGK
jgi:protein-disulfide isomerase